MKVAFVHDWLVTYRGGEKVLNALLELYPQAPIFTLFYDSRFMPDSIKQRKIITPLGLNLFKKLRKALLPILPTFIESFDLSEFDLIISTSSCVAKGIIPPPWAKHICYLHSPMRYIWDQRYEYINNYKKFWPLHILASHLSSKLRIWDITSATRVDKFIVNSTFVSQRVNKYYNKPSIVIHPPIELDFFKPSPQKSGDYFLAAGAFVKYKKFDLAIKVFNKIGIPLIVAGAGPMEKQLKKIAKQNIHFEIAPDNTKLLTLLQNAKALIFPGIEDFGMIAIEAMACGTPVIAYKQGGALDFIIPNQTGEFFTNPSVESLTQVIKNFDESKYNTQNLITFASGFNKHNFLNKIKYQIDLTLKGNN